MPTIAAVDGGTYFHHRTLREPPFGDYFDAIVYVRDVPAADLSGYDTLFLPCRLNAELIAVFADKLLAFMAGGGTLVVMGETFADRWLPGIDFTPVETNFWWWLTPGADLGVTIARPEHPLFRRLDRAGATWHLHGTFAVSPNQTSLIETADGGSLLFEDTVTYAPGRLIATTLDPCYHHGSHFMPATTRFLEAFLPWLKEEPA